MSLLGSLILDPDMIVRVARPRAASVSKSSPESASASRSSSSVDSRIISRRTSETFLRSRFFSIRFLSSDICPFRNSFVARSFPSGVSMICPLFICSHVWQYCPKPRCLHVQRLPLLPASLGLPFLTFPITRPPSCLVVAGQVRLYFALTSYGQLQ